MNLNEQTIIRQILQSEYEKRRVKNPAYSQRAFAKKLGLNSGTLSGLLQGKRKITRKAASGVITRLELEENFERWVSQIFARRQAGKNLVVARAPLDLDRFEIIANPVHLNALNLLRTARAQPNALWLARKLKVSSGEIHAVLDRLERANLVSRVGRRFVPTAQSVETPANFPHHAVRAFHKGSLLEAAAKLETVPVALRDFSSVTIPADPAKMEQVRALIHQFIDQVSLLLGSTPGTEVYKLAVQFYPVASDGEGPGA